MDKSLKLHIDSCKRNAGQAMGICYGLIAIAVAVAYSRTKESYYLEEFKKYSSLTLDHAVYALGICAGLLAIARAFLI